MAVELSAEQLRRRARRIMLIGFSVGLGVGISFGVLTIGTYSDSAQQFSGPRYFLGITVLMVGAIATAAAAAWASRVFRREPPLRGSTYEQRLRAGNMVRSGTVPADGDVALARLLCQRAVRKGRARVIAMAPVPVTILGAAIMLRGRSLDIVFVVYAILGWLVLLPSLLLMRRANRFLAAASDH